MGFLANILSWLVGKGLGSVTVPMMALGLLITVHQLIKKDREEKVQKIEHGSRCPVSAKLDGGRIQSTRKISAVSG